MAGEEDGGPDGIVVIALTRHQLIDLLASVDESALAYGRRFEQTGDPDSWDAVVAYAALGAMLEGYVFGDGG